MAIQAKLVFNHPDLKVVVLESVTIDNYQDTRGLSSVIGRIEPLVVIVISSHGEYALDMQSKIIPLNHLRLALPCLDSIVDPLISPCSLTQ